MSTAIKTNVVRARIEPNIKKKAETILKRIGVSHSTFINMSYRAVVENKGIPLSLHIPNAETRKALRDGRDRKNVSSYATIEDFIKSLA